MIKFKITTPKKDQFDKQKFINGMKTVGSRLAKRVGKTYDDLTGQWNDAPEFDQSVTMKSTGMLVTVKTDNLKYRFVDLGTAAHTIEPKNAPMLVFQPEYTSVTQVESLQTRAGGGSGPTVFAKQVEHPGSEARNFETPINKEQIPLVIKDFYEIMEKFKVFRLETEQDD